MARGPGSENLSVRKPAGGDYEIWFVVVFEPGEARAYWFRYTRFSPSGDGEQARAMVWAAAFDARASRPARAGKVVLPGSSFASSGSEFSVTIGDASIGRGRLRGGIAGELELGWDLRFEPAQKAAKRVSSLLGILPLPVHSHHPNSEVRFEGEVVVDGERRVLRDAIGTQLHIHGTKRVSELRWVYVPRFDAADAADAADASALELTSGQLGSSSPAVKALWLGGQGLLPMTSIWSSPRIKIDLPRPGMLRAQATSLGQRVILRAWADPSAFVGYRYRDPKGTDVAVAQSDIASCQVEVFKRQGLGWRPYRSLACDRGAALELHGSAELEGVSYIDWEATSAPPTAASEPDQEAAGELGKPASPGRILAFGLTYREHLRETGMVGQKPVIFDKHPRSWTASAQTVAVPSSEQLLATVDTLEPGLASELRTRLGFLPAMMDYEVELGIQLLEPVTAQELRAGARPRVGYFIANDLTARSVQILGEGQPEQLSFWSLSKSMDGFLPVGGLWVPPAEQRSQLPSLTLRTWVNGELRQQCSTDELVLSLPQLLAAAAEYVGGALSTGDVILSGTPSGVALTVPAWKRKLAGMLLDRFSRLNAAISSYSKDRRFCGPGDLIEVDGEFLGRRRVCLGLGSR